MYGSQACGVGDCLTAHRSCSPADEAPYVPYGTGIPKERQQLSVLLIVPSECPFLLMEPAETISTSLSVSLVLKKSIANSRLD